MLLLGIIVYLKFRIDWVPIYFFILYYYYEHMCIICMCRHLYHSTQVKVRGHLCSLLSPSAVVLFCGSDSGPHAWEASSLLTPISPALGISLEHGSFPMVWSSWLERDTIFFPTCWGPWSGEGFLQSLVRGEPPLLQGPFPVCRLICWSRHPRAGAEQAALSFGRLGGVVRADFPSQMLKEFWGEDSESRELKTITRTNMEIIYVVKVDYEGCRKCLESETKKIKKIQLKPLSWFL